MTNAEKFKTAEERSKAFGNYCNSQSRGCNKCPLNKFAGDCLCRFAWLDLEYNVVLKPCPFCGGEARTVSGNSVGATLYIVECKKCFATTVSKLKEDEAISEWNRRVQ